MHCPWSHVIAGTFVYWVFAKSLLCPSLSLSLFTPLPFSLCQWFQAGGGEVFCLDMPFSCLAGPYYSPAYSRGTITSQLSAVHSCPLPWDHLRETAAQPYPLPIAHSHHLSCALSPASSLAWSPVHCVTASWTAARGVTLPPMAPNLNTLAHSSAEWFRPTGLQYISGVQAVF